MCFKKQCSACDGGKWTWAGCGAHKDQVMADVAEDERCPHWRVGRHPVGMAPAIAPGAFQPGGARGLPVPQPLAPQPQRR
mmetsp:Transcript_29832/g.86616  ORF Transcript_29832/g.86616 Transcript_29832/m.86616 type:complete len:80 (+) Transcript_29832:88-327(+)